MSLVNSKNLPIGWQPPDFNLKATDDKIYSLSDFLDKKGLLIAFTCNHCPYAQAAWPLLIELHKNYGNEINFVAINPNDEITYPEDSFNAMRSKVKELGIIFPYLCDKSQETALIYQAQCTPDIYLFKINNGNPALYYHGRINDNWQNPSRVREKNLQGAVESLINNQEPPASQPPSIGCSIKWK